MSISKKYAMMHVLFNRFEQGSAQHLIKYLPLEEQQAFSKAAVASEDIGAFFESSETFLKQIHFSWLKAPIQSKSDALKPFFLSSLSDEQASNLMAYFPDLTFPPNLSSQVKRFFIQTLYREVRPHDMLPFSFAPPSALSFLSGYSFDALIELIDLLGIYDLSENIRRIIDNRCLKNIYACLNLKKKQFLRKTLHQVSKISVPKMDLEKWNGDCQTLSQDLHKRGLLRLSKALSNKDAGLVWQVQHMLDIKRGNFLLQMSSKKVAQPVAFILTQQVVQAAEFLKSNEQK